MSRDSCLSITHLFNPQRPRWTFAVWVLSASQCWDRSNNNSQPFLHCSELFSRIFLTVMWPFTSFHTPSTWIESALLVLPTSPSSGSDQISEATHLNLTTPHLNTIAPQSLQVCRRALYGAPGLPGWKPALSDQQTWLRISFLTFWMRIPQCPISLPSGLGVILDTAFDSVTNQDAACLHSRSVSSTPKL